MLLSRRYLTNSWLLAPDQSVEGTRLATVRLRPVRTALLVPDRNTKAAAAAVESCCLSWGGYANCIVPYSPSEGISDPWRKMVEVLDPDVFVCLANEVPDEVEKYLRSKGHRHVLSHGSYNAATLVAGTLIYRALDAFMDPRDVERKSRPLVLPRYRGFPEEWLPLIARYGSMLETSGFRDEKYIMYFPRRDEARLLSTHRDFFDVREFNAWDTYDHDVTKAIHEVYVGDLDRLVPREEDEDVPYATLPGVTLAGITPVVYRSFVDPDSVSESRKQDTRVVVMGDCASVADLAFFWTLRRQRPGRRRSSFPMWLPYSHVYGERVKPLVEEASQTLARRGRGGERLHIASATLPLEYMEEQYREMFPDADITTDIADFVGPTTKYYAVEQQQPVSFVEGTGHVRRITPPGMERLQPDYDFVAHEVEIEGVRLPTVEPVEELIGGIGGWSKRLMADGSFRSIDPHKETYPGKDSLEIRLPDGWGLLEAFFDHHGYTCTSTAKSSAALGQMGLLGGVEGINVVANSKVYELIKGLCGTDDQPGTDRRPYRADRRAEAHNYFTGPLGNRYAEPILRWLIENRILLRGANIQCPRCKLTLWYAVDRIGERWTCDGCREEMPIPVRPDAVYWRYRVNELWANGQDQGTVTPLLALYAMHAQWGSSFAQEGFGYYPGIELRKREEASVPVDHIEVDLVALWGARPVLVECKESAEHLENPELAAEFAEQLADQVKLAEHIDARKLIVASPSHFPEDKSILTGQVQEGSTIEIEWWDKDTLLDPAYIAENFKPDEAEKWHLEWLGQTLASSQP